MKKILLPVITLFLIGFGLSLVSCDSNNVKELISLDVTTNNYVFSDGENIKEHLTVKGIYSDGSEQVVTDYTVSPTVVTSTTDKVTVTYQSKKKTIPISVRTDSKTLISIDVTSDKYVFDVGEEIKPHLTVKGIYSDGSEQVVTDYTVSPTVVTSTTDKVTVTYQSKTKTISISVSGSGIILNDIEVIKDTNIFNVGEDVKEHLTVKGIYSDGVKIISKEGYSTNLENDKITSTTNSVTISYTDCGVTKTKNIPITVYLLTSIEVEKRTNFFFEGENIKDLIIVKGHYTDGSEKTITDTDYSTDLTDDKITSTTNNVEISYTENGVTKTDTIFFTITTDTSHFEINRSWFNNFSGVGKDSVTSISFLKKEPKDLTNLDGLSYSISGTDLFVVGRKLIFDSSCLLMFSGFSSVTEITFSGVDTSNVTDMSFMFSDCEKLTSLDLSRFNTSKVTYMKYMFNRCYQLDSLDLSNFDTSNVTDMSFMFSDCEKLTSLDLSSFNTSKVTNMSFMFSDCEKLTSITFGDNFDTSNVTDMSFMFSDCEKLTSLDLSNFNTSKVTDMKYMFNRCYQLDSLDLSNFDTSNVTVMNSMFDSCYNLTSLDLSNFNTSKVIGMRTMFGDCSQLTTLDLCSFNIKSTVDRHSVDTMDMFLNVRKTIPIYVREPSDWRSKFIGYNFQRKP